MNKKGFTLAELLAVIAILAILVLIAIPNVMQLYNESKKETFTTELKLIVKAARNQWMNESMIETNEKVYARCKSGTCPNQLNLSGRKELEYYVKMNKNGNITKLYATDGSYQYAYSGKNLKEEDIKNIESISNIATEEDKISVNCINGVPSYNAPRKCLALSFVTRQNSGSLTPGDEVVFASENFYVVSSNEDQTIFFTKYYIDAPTNSQKQSGTSVTFSNSGYWDGCKSDNEIKCTSSPMGLLSQYGTGYSAYVYDQNCNAYPYVNLYTEKLSDITGVSITGRLISSSELYSLKMANQYGANAVKGNGGYWIGNVINYASPQWVGNGGYTDFTLFTLSNMIRPVIIINTLDLCD